MPVKGGRKLKALLLRARAAQRSSVKKVEVGFFATAKYRDGTPVPNVAAWQEFGAPGAGIPERPFFRNSLEDAHDVLLPILKRELDPETLKVGPALAGKLGLAMAGRIQREITDLRKPPNRPGTVRRKRSKNPLIDTGFMRQSVTFRVDE